MENKDRFGRTPLFWSVVNNDFDMFEYLILKGANLDVMDYQGNTPILYATKDNNTSMVKMLLSNGADTNIRDFEGMTLLMWASKLKNKDIFSFFVDNKGEISKTDKYKNNALIYASISGAKDLVLELLKKGAYIEHLNNSKRDSLISAVQWGKTEVVKVLLKNGADLKLLDDKNRNALSYASEFGYYDIAFALMEAGADFNNTDIYGKSPLSYAAREGHVSLIRLLSNFGGDMNHPDLQGNTPIFDAISKLQIKAVDILLEMGADYKHVNEDKLNAIDYAIYLGEPDILDIFVKYKISFNEENLLTGITPLNLALNLNKTKLIEYLTKHKADFYKLDRNKISPIQKSLKKNNFDAFMIFVKYGADIDGKFYGTDTALLYYIEKEDAFMVEQLLKRGASPDAFNKKTNVYPLNLAISKKNFPIFMLLIRYGAKVNLPKNVVSPLMNAVFLNDLPVINVLAANGANLNERDKDGFTVLMRFSQMGNEKITEALLKAKADMYAKDKNNNDAFFIAMKYRNEKNTKFVFKIWL